MNLLKVFIGLVILGLSTQTSFAYGYNLYCNTLYQASSDAQFKYNLPFRVRAETTASGIGGSGYVNYPARARITTLSNITYKVRLPGVTWSTANYLFLPVNTKLLADGVKYNLGSPSDRELTTARRVTAANTKWVKTMVYTNPAHPLYRTPLVSLQLAFPGKPTSIMTYKCQFQ